MVTKEDTTRIKAAAIKVDITRTKADMVRGAAGTTKAMAAAAAVVIKEATRTSTTTATAPPEGGPTTTAAGAGRTHTAHQEASTNHESCFSHNNYR